MLIVSILFLKSKRIVNNIQQISYLIYYYAYAKYYVLIIFIQNTFILASSTVELGLL